MLFDKFRPGLMRTGRRGRIKPLVSVPLHKIHTESAGPYNARSVAFLITVYKFMRKTIRKHDFRYVAIFYHDMI